MCFVFFVHPVQSCVLSMCAGCLNCDVITYLSDNAMQRKKEIVVVIHALRAE